VPRSNNGWGCTSTPPVRLHGVVLSWGGAVVLWCLEAGAAFHLFTFHMPWGIRSEVQAFPVYSIVCNIPELWLFQHTETSLNPPRWAVVRYWGWEERSAGFSVGLKVKRNSDNVSGWGCPRWYNGMTSIRPTGGGGMIRFQEPYAVGGERVHEMGYLP